MTNLNVGSITKSVTDLWEFVAPPIWLLFLVLLIVACVNRIGISDLPAEISRQLQRVFSILVKEGTAEKTNWFYTAIVVFTFLSALHLTRNSGDIYEQAVVKAVAGFFRGNPTHLFGVTRFGAPVVCVRAGSIHLNEVAWPQIERRI